MLDSRRIGERRRKVLPPTAEEIESAYRAISAQIKYASFVETLVETVCGVFKARACVFADRITGQSWRFEAGDVAVRPERQIQSPGKAWMRVGAGCDLDAPYFDGDGLYALAALERGPEHYGWIYIYSPAEFEDVERLRYEAMATYAAVILQNIRLMEFNEKLAYSDTLTSLPNRRALENEISRLVHAKSAFTYVLMDLDNFKAINDTRGHDAGDAALKRVADALRSAARRNDYVGRFAGDEFIALIAGAEVEPFLTRLRTILAPYEIGISSGAAPYPADGDNIMSLYKSADDRLFAMKKERKSRRT